MDNYYRWRQYESEREESLLKLPMCTCCEEHIQDEYYYEIGNLILCESCLNDNYRKDVGDYD